jgi:hypothetical protein
MQLPPPSFSLPRQSWCRQRLCGVEGNPHSPLQRAGHTISLAFPGRWSSSQARNKTTFRQPFLGATANMLHWSELNIVEDAGTMSPPHAWRRRCPLRMELVFHTFIGVLGASWQNFGSVVEGGEQSAGIPKPLVTSARAGECARMQARTRWTETLVVAICAGECRKRRVV